MRGSLRELELLDRGAAIASLQEPTLTLSDEDIEDIEEAPEDEAVEREVEVLDRATAARTLDELRVEIATLKNLVKLARGVLHNGEDCKWRELGKLLEIIYTRAALAGRVGDDNAHYRGATGIRRPERRSPEAGDFHRASRPPLAYLTERIQTLIGDPDAVVVIHGGIARAQRLQTQEAFRYDPKVRILVATDAAGEGVQPAECPSDGQLRFAVEPQPSGAAIRAHTTASANRKSATCGIWLRRAPERALCT